MSGCRVVISVLVVDPRDHGADWELWFTAVAQHHKRGWDHTSLDQEKIKIQNLKYKSRDLETVIQSEVSQKEKNKYRILMHVCGT